MILYGLERLKMGDLGLRVAGWKLTIEVGWKVDKSPPQAGNF